MANRAHHCKYRSVVPDAVCFSKCAVAAAAGIFPLWCSPAERNGPLVGDDLRSNRFNCSLRASSPRFLFVAAAFRSLNLSPGSIEDHAAVTRRSRRFLMQQRRPWKEAYAEKFLFNSWIYVRSCLFRCGRGLLRADKARDEA